MRTCDEIRLVLAKEVEEATVAFGHSVEDFGRVVAELDAAVASTDRRLALQLAGDRRRRAFDALQRAIDRYNKLVLHGILPEDLTGPT